MYTLQRAGMGLPRLRCLKFPKYPMPTDLGIRNGSRQFPVSTLQKRLQSVQTTPIAREGKNIEFPKQVTSPAQYKGILQELASRSSPTVLYKAPNQRSFVIISYATGFTLLAMSGWWVTFNMELAQSVPWFVHLSYGSSAIILFGLGCYMLSATSGLVKTIKAVPAKRAAGRTIKLVIESKTLPWSKVTATEAALGEVVASRPLGMTLGSFHYWAEQDALAMAGKKDAIFLTRWARAVNQSLYRVAMYTKQMLFRTGIIFLEANGNKGFKVDPSGTMGVDHKVIDALIKSY